jgi:hypothetical protein
MISDATIISIYKFLRNCIKSCNIFINTCALRFFFFFKKKLVLYKFTWSHSLFFFFHHLHELKNTKQVDLSLKGDIGD